MQEQVKFNISENYSTVGKPETQAVLAELQSNVVAIEQLLVGYHFKARSRVFNVTIDSKTIEMISSTSGKFTVMYMIGQFNACADVDFTESASMELLLDIDLQNRSVSITGEFIFERDPDEF